MLQNRFPHYSFPYDTENLRISITANGGKKAGCFGHDESLSNSNEKCLVVDLDGK